MADFFSSKNFKNSLWNLADIFTYPVIFLLSTPFFIDGLGAKAFGVWMLVNSLMIAMQVLNLGLGNATFKHMASHSALNDHTQMNATLNTNFSLSILLHLVCILAGGLLAFGIQQFSFFNIEPSFIALAAKGALLGGVLVGFKFYEQLIGYTFKALERFDLDTMLSTGLKIVVLIVNIVLVKMGHGLTSLLINNILLSFVSILIGLLIIKFQIPTFRFQFQLNKTFIRKELKFAIWPWFQTLAIVLTFQCDRFFVVSFIGLSTLTYYGLVATIFNHIHMGFNGIAPWLAPKITKLKTQGKDTRDLYLSARNFILLLALTALLLFNLLNEPILSLFLSKEKYMQAADYIKCFTLFEVFFVFSIIPNYFLNAAGYEKLYFKIVVFYCVSILSGMLLGYYFTHTATGIIIGMALSTAITMLFQNWMINQWVFKARNPLETLALFTPAIIIGVAIWLDAPFIKYSFVALGFLSIYFVYTRYFKINFQLLKLD